MLEFIKELLRAILGFIKECLLKLALLVLFLLIFFNASALTRVILGWLNYDEASKRQISDRIGNYAALIGSLAIMGIIVAVSEMKKRSAARRKEPPEPILSLCSKAKPQVPPRYE